MKKLFFFGVLLCVATNIFSQKKQSKTSLYVGPHISIAAGDLNKTQSRGAGANAQLVNHVSTQNAVTGRVSYTYLFGKKYSTDYYVPGMEEYYNTKSKYKGASDVNIAGGFRHEFNRNIFAGLDAGLCLDFGDGESQASGEGEIELGYFINASSPVEQALTLFLGICGDPKIQVGLRYSIRLL